MPRFLGTIVRPGLLDPFYLIHNYDVLGGLKTVEDLIERDAIINAVRVEGMKVYVKSTKVYYRLEDGITNADWAIDVPAAGGNADDLVTAETDENKLLAPNGTGGVQWITPAVDVGTEKKELFVAAGGQVNYSLAFTPIKTDHVLMNGANIEGNFTIIGNQLNLDAGWSIISAGSEIRIKYFY